jgi:hypothetical protein
VDWVTPRALQEAARKLRIAVQEGQPGVAPILAVYGRGANGVDPIAAEFMQDLKDIEALAQWAATQHAPRMTLAVNW